MSAVALGVAAALVALRCELIRDDPYTLGSVSRVLPASRPAFLRALNQTRRLIGCPDSDDLKEPDPPFTGGQCPGVLYDVSVFRSFAVSPPPATDVLRREGPIGPVTSFVGTAPSAQGEPLRFWRFSYGNGQTNNLGATFLEVNGEPNPGSFTITGVVRVDGQPDVCGDPPPVYPDPIDKPRDVPIIYRPDIGPEITINIPFIFAPIRVNFDGSLRIPFTFDFGGFEFSGNINLPDFNVSINPPAIPPGSGEDLSGEGEDEPGESVEPVPLDEKIIGVVVTATQIDSRRVSSYLSPGITPIFVPRLGSIKFAYSIGTATFFSSDIDIKDRRTFVPCPFSQGADAVIASPQPGVELTFTPIRGHPIATTGDINRAA